MMNSDPIKPFSCIVAYCRKNMGIGFEGTLPWTYLKADMQHFSRVTSSQAPLAQTSADVA